MMNKKKVIPVFFAADDNYVPCLAVAIKSLIMNASRDYEYKIYVMHNDMSVENQQSLKFFEEEGFQILFPEIKEGLDKITERKTNKLRCDYFTLTIYFRLFIPAMFPQYDKGIYLDSDVVVPGDISELYNIELGDNMIGACVDLSVQEIEPIVNYFDKAVGVNHEKYINSGVLLMDLKRLRQAKLDSRFLELLTTYQFDSIAPDQDYINSMCDGNIMHLPAEWDIMPNENRAEVEKPKLIHYNLFAKPWMYDNIQYEDYFWDYAKKAGFYEINQLHKKNYTEENKAADRQSLETMIRMADEIVATGSTFAAVFNTGKEERLSWSRQTENQL